MPSTRKRVAEAGARLLSTALIVLLIPGALAAMDLPPLPEGIASFGAAVTGDELYVFGGHVGKTHQHSIENLSHRFLRLDLKSPDQGWQEIGEVTGLQGLPMVPHGSRVCRVGGLSALNHQDAEDEDLVSVADVACFDAKDQQWHELPPLPQPRSSHDAVVVGDHLYAVGGWQLRGAGNKPIWIDNTVVLDLAAENPEWKSIPQPFQRRALTVATAGGKVFAFGGLGSEKTSRQVDVYDPSTDSWSQGPELPEMGERLKGFGVSAFGVEDRIYLSGADGIVHSIGAGDAAWQERLGKLDTPRFFHRLLPHRDRLLFVAGAARSGHLADLESLAIADLKPGAVETIQVAGPATKPDRGSWPGFRGLGQGRMTSDEVPVEWSGDDVAWRVDLPGYGQSAPVIWKGQVFITSVAGANKEEIVLSAFDLESGELRWRRRFESSQKGESSEMYSRGAPTPAVDGSRIYAFWETGDLMAFDHRGETLWKRSLTKEYGEFTGNHGVASSPVLTADSVIVQVTHEGPSYFLAADKETGENHWKVDRPAKVAWTTPAVIAGASGSEIVSSAGGRVEALSAADGEILWQMNGVEKNHVPSLTVEGDLLIVASSEAGHNFALRRAKGQAVGEDDIVWRAEGVTSGFGSPIVANGCVLFTNKAGAVTCIDPASGAKQWTHRLPEATWASPIAAGRNVYFFTKKGVTAVLQPNSEGPGPVAENALPFDGTVYGAAAVRGAFVIRSGQELVRVGRESVTANSTTRGGDVVLASRDEK